MLEPCFNIRCDKLSPFWTIGVLYDWTERSGDTVAQGIIDAANAEDDDAEPSYDAADGRGWKYSSLVNGCAISSEPTGLPSGPLTMLPLA